MSKQEWRPIPHMGEYSKDPHEIIEKHEEIPQIDILKEMQPLLDESEFLKIYKKSLSLMDIANICTKNCPFCYADALHPNRTKEPKFISAESWKKALKDEKFRSLFTNSLRMGSSGDIGDHPQIVDIVKSALEFLPNTQIKLWSNYSRTDKERIKELVALVRKYNDKAKKIKFKNNG